MTASLIDLHLHTTASDGRLSPRELVARVAAAGVCVMAVTDHDTVAAVDEVCRAAVELNVDAVAGIEVTAVEDGRDVHVLGYFVDPQDATLAAFLGRQREQRVARVRAIAERLSRLGVPIEVESLLEYARREPGRSIGRPQVARALVEAGHVADVRGAFDRWLGADRPGFIPREGPTVQTVVATLHAASGLASLAHPGKIGMDARIPSFREAGLDAIEVFHSDHDEAMRRHYAGLAASLGCLVTGGSDFHGDPGHGREPGGMSLPVEEWERLRAAAPGHA